jgi:hypothetical protein
MFEISQDLQFPQGSLGIKTVLKTLFYFFYRKLFWFVLASFEILSFENNPVSTSSNYSLCILVGYVKQLDYNVYQG